MKNSPDTKCLPMKTIHDLITLIPSNAVENGDIFKFGCRLMIPSKTNRSTESSRTSTYRRPLTQTFALEAPGLHFVM